MGNVRPEEKISPEELRISQKLYSIRNVYSIEGLSCSYSELFWSAFSRIQTEYEEIRSIDSPSGEDVREC